MQQKAEEDGCRRMIKSGQLLTDAMQIERLKSGDLLQQLQMWIRLKTSGMQMNHRKGAQGFNSSQSCGQGENKNLAFNECCHH